MMETDERVDEYGYHNRYVHLRRLKYFGFLGEEDTYMNADFRLYVRLQVVIM
jgi:hypothetical protein